MLLIAVRWPPAQKALETARPRKPTLSTRRFTSTPIRFGRAESAVSPTTRPTGPHASKPVADGVMRRRNARRGLTSPARLHALALDPPRPGTVQWSSREDRETPRAGKLQPAPGRRGPKRRPRSRMAIREEKRATTDGATPPRARHQLTRLRRVALSNCKQARDVGGVVLSVPFDGDDPSERDAFKPVRMAVLWPQCSAWGGKSAQPGPICPSDSAWKVSSPPPPRHLTRSSKRERVATCSPVVNKRRDVGPIVHRTQPSPRYQSALMADAGGKTRPQSIGPRIHELASAYGRSVNPTGVLPGGRRPKSRQEMIGPRDLDYHHPSPP